MSVWQPSGVQGMSLEMQLPVVRTVPMCLLRLVAVCVVLTSRLNPLLVKRSMPLLPFARNSGQRQPLVTGQLVHYVWVFMEQALLRQDRHTVVHLIPLTLMLTLSPR